MTNDTKIVVIDDLLPNNSPLLVLLREKYNGKNVSLFQNPQEGLDYVLGHLSNKIILRITKRKEEKETSVNKISII